jgi:hypothetical protein
MVNYALAEALRPLELNCWCTERFHAFLTEQTSTLIGSKPTLLWKQVRASLPPGVDGWGYSLKGMMGMVVIGGFLVGLTYFYLNRTVVKRITAGQPKKKKVLLLFLCVLLPACSTWYARIARTICPRFLMLHKPHIPSIFTIYF